MMRDHYFRRLLILAVWLWSLAVASGCSQPQEVVTPKVMTAPSISLKLYITSWRSLADDSERIVRSGYWTSSSDSIERVLLNGAPVPTLAQQDTMPFSGPVHYLSGVDTVQVSFRTSSVVVACVDTVPTPVLLAPAYGSTVYRDSGLLIVGKPLADHRNLLVELADDLGYHAYYVPDTLGVVRVENLRCYHGARIHVTLSSIGSFADFSHNQLATSRDIFISRAIDCYLK